MYNESYLVHHGVKGMKWGVRRQPDTVANKLRRQRKEQREKILSGDKLKKDRKKSRDKILNRKLVEVINNNANQQIDFLQQQQIMEAQRWQMEQSDLAARRTASLGMSGGMNPFMFG